MHSSIRAAMYVAIALVYFAFTSLAAKAATWQPCELIPGSGTNDAECVSVQVPEDYFTWTGELDIWVKRLPATSPSRGQLWLLAGGPGGGATSTLASRMASMGALANDLDIYTFDHRGSGNSQRLTCPAQEAPQSEGGAAITETEWPPCLASLQSGPVDLDNITTTQAAIDLGMLVRLTRLPTDAVFVWGGSYGTYHAQRYLHLFPTQPTGVILEGIAPSGLTWSAFDQRFSEVAQTIVEMCSGDPSCAARLGPDPWDYVSQARAVVDSGQCNLGYNGATWANLLGLLLYNQSFRETVPGLAYRVMRCSPEDLAVYDHLLNFIGDASSGNSAILFNHVWSSEGWPGSGPPPLSELGDIANNCVLCLYSAPRLAMRYDTWPRYIDWYDNWFPVYDGPMLMMQGALDPATPLAEAQVMQLLYNGLNQYFIPFPTGGHTLSGNSPTLTGGDCGHDILAGFLQDPTALPDTSCVADIRPIDFDGGDPAAVEALLGTTDVWGD